MVSDARGAEGRDETVPSHRLDEASGWSERQTGGRDTPTAGCTIDLPHCNMDDPGRPWILFGGIDKLPINSSYSSDLEQFGHIFIDIFTKATKICL